MKLLLLIFLALPTGILYAQNNQIALQDTSWQTVFLNAPEVVLPQLMDAAITYSAEIERLEADRQISNENFKLLKKNYLNGLSLGTGYSYGTILNIFSGDQIVSNFNAFDLPARAQYTTGVSINYSLYDLFGRRNEINIKKLEQQKAEAGRKMGEREIRRAVINLYQEIILAKEQLELYQEAFQSANIHLKLAERQFENGEILVSEMSKVNETYASAAIAHRTATIKYKTAILMMEEIIGMRIIELMLKKDEN